MPPAPAAAPIQAAVFAGRSTFHRTGTPPKVSPMKSEYMTQRISMSAWLTSVAKSAIAHSAGPTTAASVSSVGARKRRRESSEIASMKRR